MIPLFWIFVVHSICCLRLALPATSTFSYTGLSIATAPLSGTVQTPGSSTTQFKNAAKVVIDTSGNLYIADSGNHVIKKIPLSTSTPVIVAGTGVAGFSSSDTIATSAQLNTPMDVSFDNAGNIYIADTYNHVIRKVTSTGIISTVIGSGTQGSGCATTVATSCQLNTPMGIYSTLPGALYVADTNNHVIRKLTGTQFTSNLWGQSTTAVAGTTGDNGPATSSNVFFSYPTCIIRAPDNSFWICDTRSRVRRINQLTGGFITTAAGSITTGSTGDGGPATLALLSNPMQVSCVGTSVVTSLCYIADTDNSRIRVVQNFTYAIAPSVAPTFAPTPAPTLAPVTVGTSAPTTASPVTTSGPTSLSVNIQNYVITTVAGTGTAGYSTGNGTSFLVPFRYQFNFICTSIPARFLRNLTINLLLSVIDFCCFRVLQSNTCE